MTQQKHLGKLLAELGCKRGLAQFAWAMCTAINSRGATGGTNLRTRIEFGVGTAPAPRQFPRSEGVEFWEGAMVVEEAIKALCSKESVEFDVGRCRVARSDQAWSGYTPMDLGYGFLGSPPRYVATTQSAAGAAGSSLKEMLSDAMAAGIDGPSFVDAVHGAAWWFGAESAEKLASYRSGEIEVLVPIDPGQVRDLWVSEEGFLAVELEPGIQESEIAVHLALDEIYDGNAIVALPDGGTFAFDRAPKGWFTVLVFVEGKLHAHCKGHRSQVPVRLPDRIDRDIEQLIIRGEGEHVEFKQVPPGNSTDWNSTAWMGVVKTVLAFGNCGGGDLLVGVADDGEIVGIDSALGLPDRSPEERIHGFVKLLRRRLTEGTQWSPRISCDYEAIGGKTVLWVRVAPNSPGQNASLLGDAYFRAGSTTRRARNEDYQELNRRATSNGPFRMG